VKRRNYLLGCDFNDVIKRRFVAGGILLLKRLSSLYQKKCPYYDVGESAIEGGGS